MVLSARIFCISGSLACLLSVSGCARQYRASGLLLSYDPVRQSALVSHQEVPGVMPAMSMPVPVERPEQLRDAHTGSRVEVQFQKRRSRVRVAGLRLLPPNTGVEVPVPRPANEVAVGQPMPDFALVNTAGDTVRLSGWRGRFVLVQFLYTRCPLPEVCPRLASQFAYLQKRLPLQSHQSIELVSITLDPQHDTPAVLREYARRWQAGPRWHFLTGSWDDVAKVAERCGLVYWPEAGLITHTSAIVMISPGGTLLARIEGTGHTTTQLADVITHTMQNSRETP